MQFPILSVIVFTPIVAGLLILLIPAERKTEVRVAALAAGAFALLLSIWVYFSYDVAAGGYQFVEKYAWLPPLGISYHVGVDGMNAPLVLLTGVVMFTGVLISWGIDDRPREFFAFLFILATGVFGVFVALDLFMLFFFYEIAVFPMYLLISIWGWKVTREYAAMKLTLYLFIGSVVALVGALAMYFASGLGTFDMIALEKADFSVGIPAALVSLCVLRFCRSGRYLPLPQLEPGWSRGCADRGLDVPCRCADEAGRIRCPAGGHHAAAGRRQVPYAVDHPADPGQCGVWRVYRQRADRFQICHRFLVRLAHGPGGDGFCHPEPDRVCWALGCRCSRTA